MTATSSAFKVRSWRPHSKNTLLGFLALELPSGLVINDITLHQKAGARWVSMPAKEYLKDGEKTWVPLIEFANKDVRGSFQACALSAIDAYLGESNDRA